MLIKEPEFKDPPKTDAADVNENIDNWLDNGKTKKIAAFLRPDPKGHRGYRFVRWDDLTQKITTTQKLCGLEFEVTHIRHFHTTDHLCPLWFSRWYDRDRIILRYKEHVFDWESDAHLKRFCKARKAEEKIK